MILLCSCDLGTAYTACNCSLDTLCAKSHSSAHNLLHSAAERDTVLKLCCDVLRNELSVCIRVLYLHDIEVYGLACELLYLSLQLLYLCAAAADDYTRLSCVDSDKYSLLLSLNTDLSDAGIVAGLLYKLSDLVIFNQLVSEFSLACEPC